jgi:hypothetical protein
MVVTTGWLQIADVALVLVSTCGITFAMFGRWFENGAVDVLTRCLLAAVSFLCMFYPDMRVSAAVAAVVLAATVFGIWRHRQIAPPKTPVAAVPVAGEIAGDLTPMLAEAKRDIG